MALQSAFARSVATRRVKRRRWPIHIWGRLVVYALLALMSLVAAIPFLWMISSSLMSYQEANSWPPHLIPERLRFDNYTYSLITGLPIALFFWNSTKIALLTVSGMLLSCSIIAYAFARVEFRGKGILFGILLATLMVPYQVTMVPVFVIFKTIGWYGTHLPLWAPAWTGNAYWIFLFRQFFMTLPKELDEAAVIDGATPGRIWWNIYMPLSKPVLATVAVFSFVGSWNDFFNPLIYLRDEKLYTIQIALAYYRNQYTIDIPHLMSMSILAMLPTLALFVAAQRYFVQGIALTGLKI
ncbi:MAG: carbohydrate ABC transporter permease [Anaerolineae bacterium]